VRARSAWLGFLFLWALACSPPSSSDDTDSDAAPNDAVPGADADSTLGPERSCETVFRYVPSSPVGTVELAGEWNWSAPEAMPSDGAGGYALAKTLDPGVYAYKLVVDDNWILDPGNAYRKYDGGVENSGMRVEDCHDPQLVLDSFATTADGATAVVDVLRGAGGSAIDSDTVTVTLLHDFADSAAAHDFSNHQISAAPSGLAAGKYTLLFEASDLDGRPAKPLHLPFWVEADTFDWRDSIIYMVMTDRFRDGNPGNDPGPTANAEPTADWYGGDFAGVTAAIEEGYFDALGVRALWLSPFARNPDGPYFEGTHGVTGYHGYWPIRAREVEPRLGTPAELEAMVEAAHAHGIRVLMDFVINHVHEEHEYYAAHPEWFRTGCVCGTAGCDWTEHRLDCLFHPYMPDVNWQVQAASEAIIGDAIWWLERFDLDGLRVDAVKHVEDLAIFNLSTRISEELEQAGTEYFLMGETAMGWNGHTIEENLNEYGTISRYIGPYGLNGQFDFVLYHAVSYNVFAHDTYGLIHADFWTKASLDNYPADAIMTPYVGSHDTQRIVSLSDSAAASVVYNKWPDDGLPAEPSAAEPYGRAAVALAWVLTLPGAPLLYYGDEYGSFGGSDPDNRHMWRAAAQRSAAESALFDFVSRVGSARRASSAIRRGEYSTLLAEETFLCYARHTATDVALVALNHSDAPATRQIDYPSWLPRPAVELQDALRPESSPIGISADSVTVTVPARSAAILVPVEP